MPDWPNKRLSARPRRSLILIVLAAIAAFILSIVSGAASAVIQQLPRQLNPSALMPSAIERIFAHRTEPTLSPPAPLPAGSDPTPQPLPYSQNFSSLAASSTTYPDGWQGWSLSASGASSSFKTNAAVADDALIASSGASNNAGGVHNYNGKIGFLQTSTDDASIALAVDTTDRVNVKVSYDIMTIRNPFNGTSNTRINQATLQYRVGTSGSFTSLTGIEYLTNTTTQTGSGVTTPQNSQTTTLFLPSACDNQSVVQLRWAGRDVGGSGSRPSFAVDNITINGTQAIVGTLFNASGNPITDGRTIKLIQNGTVSATTATTNSLGTYIFDGLTLSSGDRIATFIDGASEKGVTATLIGTPENFTSLDIKASQLTVRTDNGGSTAITNSNLAESDSSKDSDIPFAVSSGTLTTTTGTSLRIDFSSIYTPGGDINDGGNWLNDGTFTPGTFTVTMNGAANQTIGGTATPIPFYSLTIDNTGTSPNNVVTLSNNISVSNVLTVNRGVFDQNVAGNSSGVTTTGSATNVVVVNSLGTWQNFGTGAVTLSGGVSNSGTINFNGNGTPCGDVADGILIRSSDSGNASPTQRTWSGTGTFSMTDVNVKDQKVPGGLTPPLFILVNSGTNAGNNTGWTFVDQCTSGTYTWIGGTVGANTDWTVGTNWNPTRAAANGDILIFDGTSTPAPTVTNVPAQTIAALRLTNSVNGVTLNAGADGNQLTISGSTGNDFSVSNGCLLTLNGSNALTIQVNGANQGSVSGEVILQGGAHRLIGAAASAITFASGSKFTTTAGFTGNPFGTGTDGSVILGGGSSSFFGAGSDPFGGDGHSVVTFGLVPMSNQEFSAASALSTNGRTYGNLTLNGNQTFAGAGSGQSTVGGNFTLGNSLTLTDGSTFKLSDNVGGNLNLFGNFSDVSTNANAFNANGRTVLFQGGSTTQTIFKQSGTESFFDVFILKTGGSVQLSSPVKIDGALQFGAGGSPIDVLELNSNSLTLNGTIGSVPAATSGLKGDLTGSSLTITTPSALNPVHFISGSQSLSSLVMNGHPVTTIATFDTDLTLGRTNPGTPSLVLTNGIVKMSGTTTLTVNSNVSISRTNGWINGNEQRYFVCNTICTIPFDVGTDNGYSPVSEVFHPNANTTYNQTVKAIEGQHPSIHNVSAHALQRYWTVGTPAPAIGSADITFNYLAGDVVGTASSYVFFRNSAGTWFPLPPTGTPTNTSATINGVSTFSDWTLAEASAVTPGTIQFAAANTNFTELNSGTNNATITLQRVGGSDGVVSVDYNTGGGTAASGSDYTSVSGTISWLDGDSTDKQILIPVVGDTTYEANETVNVTLSIPQGTSITGTNPATLTIVNDDPAPCAPPPTGMRAWWKAENNADDSAGTHNGLMQNGATFAAGKVGQAFSFNGSFSDMRTDFDNTNDYSLNGLNPISVDLWANFNTVPRTGNANNNMLLLAHEYRYQLYWRADTEVIEFDVADACDAQFHLGFTAPLPTLAAGAWHHYAVTAVDGGASGPTFHFYFDGVEQTITAIPNGGHLACGWYPYGQDVVLGRRINLFPFWAFNGLIDEVEIFNRAITASEVTAIYNADSAGKCSASTVSVAVAPASVIEDEATNLVYTFTRDGDISVPVTVNFNVSGGAQFGTDYGQSGAASFTTTTGSVSFAAGSVKATVTVDPSSDSTVEPDETVVLTLASGSGYYVGTPDSATGTILNDDGPPDLVLNKTDAVDPATEGNLLVYTLTTTNNGGPATNVTLTDTLPANVTFAYASAGCNESGGLVTCSLGTLTFHQTATTTIAVIPTHAATLAGSVTNSATVSETESDVTPSDNSDSETTTIVGPTCTAPPSGITNWYPADSNASDVIGARNGTLTNGASLASGHVGNAFSLNGTNQYVGITNRSDLASNFSMDAWIYPTSVANDAWIYSAEIPDPFNTAIGFYVVAGGKLLAGTRGSSGHTQYWTNSAVIVPNQWQHVVVTYNGGTGQGSGQAFKIYVNGVNAPAIPAGPFSDQGGATLAGASYNNGNAKIGSHYTGTSGFFPGLIDEVEIFNRILTPTEALTLYNAATAGKCLTNLSVLKSDSADPTPFGSDLTYTIKVSYRGPSPATNVVAVDPLPANVNFVTASSGCTNSSGTVTCNIGTLNSFETAVRTITVTPLLATYGATISNTVTVSSDAPETITSDNTATETTGVGCTPKPSGMTNWWRSNNNAVDIIGGQNGAMTNGATFAAGKVNQAFSFNGTNQYVGITNRGDFASNFSMDAWIYPTSVANDAWIYSAEIPDPFNTAIGFYVQAGGKLIAGTRGSSGHTQYITNAVAIVPNQWQHVVVTYNGSAGTNSGQSFKFYVNGVLFSSVKAGPFSDQSGSTLAGASYNNGNAKIGSHYTGTSGFFPGLIDEVEIFNRILTPTEALALYNAGALGKCVVTDLSLTKADSPDPVAEANNLTYTLTAHNGGPDNASGVTITDTLPANVSFVTASPGCVESSGAVTCDVGTLANGADAVRTITVTPTHAAAGTTLSNTASVTGAEPDLNGSNNSATQMTTVAATPDVSVAVSPASRAEDSGLALAYTFTRTVTTGTLTVNFSVGGSATFGSDCGQSGAATFNTTSGTVSFADGASTATVNVTPTADTVFESDETFVLTVTAGTAYNVAANPNDSAAGTITNDDVPATTLVVNTTADTDDGFCTTDPGGCTLREAINAANFNPDVNTINFDSTVFAAPGPYTIDLTGALPTLSTGMNINGPGLNLLTVQRGSGSSFRIFFIGFGFTQAVNISGLTISGGADAAGGGIYNGGTLTLTNSTVSGNTSSGAGGGIYNGGDALTLTNSTVSGNTGAGIGGGIGNNATLTLTNSTVSGNGGGIGGGIGNTGGTVTLTNSTVSGNSANSSNDGGGIFTQGGTLTLTNSTVSVNTALNGGGVSNLFSTVNVRNTVIAGNSAPSTGPDISGSFTSLGHNLIGNGTGGSGFTGSGDQVGTGGSPINPHLDALANYGGPTQTHRLQTTSPAIDAGDNCVFDLSCSTGNPPSALTTDQRGAGFSRKLDGNSDGTAVVDIGAYEAPACTTPPATPSASNGGPYCEGATIQLSTPAVSGATYAWTGPNSFTSALQNPTRAGATTADAGTYSVTVTVDGCTSAAGTTNVVVNATPATPTASNGGPYCEGATIQLSTPTVSGATYSWTGPNGFTSANQNPTRANATTADAGTYSVTVTVNGCTSAAGTTNVVVNATPATPTASNGGPYCEGATISLSTPFVSGATYSWTGPNGFTSSAQNPTRANATTADAGTYSVTITVNGCTSAAGTTNVVVNATPATPTASNGGPYCEGATIQLSTPTVAGATYAWTGPNSFTSSAQNPTRENATTADAGTYSVTLTVNGCTSAAGTTNVVVNPTPATPTAANGGPYCEGATISLSTPTVSGATYAWTGPNGFTSSAQNPTRANATTADAGTYSITVTVNGCTSAAGTTNVAVNANSGPPTLSYASPQSVTNGNSLTITPATGPSYYASVSGIVVQDAGGYPGSLSVDNATGVVRVSDAVSPGSYTITIRASDNCSGNTDATFTLNVNAATCATPPSGMVAWYPGDGNAHDIKGGNNGTLQNGANFAAGKVNSAFSFDGLNDFVQAPGIALPVGNSDRTMDAWVYMNALPASETFFVGYGGFGSSNRAYELGTVADGTLFFSQWGTGITGPQLQPDTWYHIAVTNVSNSATLYLNGTVVGTASVPIDTASGTDLFIGRAPGSFGDSRILNGRVDEVEVFDRALDPTEVANIYKASFAGKCRTCTTAPGGMISWWNGSGSAPTANDIAGPNPGTLQNGAIFAPGKAGQGFSFNGTSAYVSVGNDAVFNFTNAMTVDAWVKSDGLTMNFAPIVDKGDGSWRLQTYGDTNFASFGTTGLSDIDLVGTSNIIDGQWHHVAGVIDGSTKYLYVDGVLDASVAVSGSINVTGDEVRIGGLVGTPGFSTDRFWSGSIDEVELFNRALSPTEIAAIADAGNGGKCPISRTTTTTITNTAALANPTAAGVPYTVEWSVTSDNGLPSGTVSVTVDGNPGCSAAVSAGQCQITPSGPGTFALIATYSGDQNFDTSASGQVSHAVSAATYTINASAGAHGSIDPSGAVSVNPGGDQTFNITADAHYHIADVLVDSVSVGAVSSYPFTNVTANHTIAASFAANPCPISPIVVNTTDDTDDVNALSAPDGVCLDSNGKCSLRAAIQEANAAANSCGTIDIYFDAGVFANPQEIRLEGDLPAIQHDVNVNGPGSGRLKIDGDLTYSIFKIDSGYTVAISDLTITHGYSGDDGGGVSNEGGAVTLTNCAVTENYAEAEGGGIYSSGGSLTLTNCTVNLNFTGGDGGGIYNSDSSILMVTTSTIHQNFALYLGGGIFNCSGSNATVTNSTLSGNSATDGGGVFNEASLKVSNSTISGNTAENSGGGIYDGGTLALVNVTIIDNRCDNDDDTEGDGGGIYAFGGSASSRTLLNTIVAGNFRGCLFGSPAPAPDNSRGGGGVTGSFNLIGPNSDSPDNSAPNHDNLLNVTNPKLGPLDYYGGPTQTHGLLIGSPAIDAGDNCVLSQDGCGDGNEALATDQRGGVFNRNLDGDGANGARVDIGAFEFAVGAGTNGDDLAVNTTADHDDGACDPLSAEGDCTLREAINAANASPDSNQIKFDIPTDDAGYLSAGTGVWTIHPQTNLPAIIYPVTIDGYTQRPCSANSAPCSQVNTDPTCNDALLLIELSGRDILGGSNIGLNIVGGSSTVRGLVINQFASEGFGAGIRLAGNGGNTITGNFIGTDASGTRAENDECELTGNSVGVQIDNCSANIIGGAIPINDSIPSAAAAARNLISANFDEGIQITGVSSSGNIIRGNFIGTDSSGSVIFDDTENENPLGNLVGIEIYDGPNNIVGNSQFAGAAVAGAGNVISGNFEIGVEISSGSTAGPTGNGVGSNFIGTDLTGMLELGNGGDGVQLCQDAHDNLVGGSTEEFGNVIAYNCGNGINLLEPTLAGNTLRLNSIHDNGYLGIDLGDDGVTLNDSFGPDADTGPNNLQNFPAIQSVLIESNAITISGYLSSTPNQTFTVDFYANASCNNGDSYGEGQSYIGSLTSVSTDASGMALLSFNGTMPANAGSVITATATDSGGSTSEFSQCFTGTVQNVALSVYKSSPSPDLAVDQESTYTITVFNNGNVAASSATVKEAIPAGLALISASGTNWTCVPAGPMSDPVGTVTCTFSGGTIASFGGSSSIDIVVKTPSGTVGNTITNKYSVDPSGGTSAPDPTTCTAANTPTSGCGQPVASLGCLSTLIVTDAGDAPDANTSDIVCETMPGNGVCTLRAAIEQANALNSCNNTITIKFDIPGAGVHTITPGSPLPAIKHPVIIDGYSQKSCLSNSAPCSKENDDPIADNAVLLIELSGAGAGPEADGLVLDADGGCTIKGLIINRFGNAGIRIPSYVNKISGNFIGTDATGTQLKDTNQLPYGNKVGVLVDNGASNFIGYTTAADRNLISGNTDDGVQITGMSAFFNFVQGNLIGVQADGAGALGNGATGVEIYEGGAFNVIGNDQPFVEDVGERNRRDQSRQISSTPLLQIARPVTLSGANVIAYNGDEGILVTSAPDIANRISQNSIYANGKLGINLVGGTEDSSGVTANDGDDPNTAPIDPDHDEGPNRLQNFPVITAVDVQGQTISGKLSSTPNTTDYVIEFFANDTCDPSGHGEGKIYLGSAAAATDGNGDATFTFSSPLVPFTAGQVITATATNPSGETSEFSPCSVVLSVSKSQPSPSLVVGQESTYTITVTNSGTAPATTATVKEAIPAGLDLVSATGTNWTCAPAGPTSDPVGVVACTFTGSIAFSGGTSTIAIQVKPKAGTAGQSVTNKYSIDPTGGETAPVPGTCTAANVPTVGCGVAVVSSVGSAPCPTIVVSPSILPDGSVGAAYNHPISASGGSGPYTFAATGSLPTGLTLNSDGTWNGMPSAAGTFNFTVTATDGNSCQGSQAYSVNISTCPTTFTVNDAGDTDDANAATAPDGVCADSNGKCTLRAAIQEANALPSCGTININFSIGSSTITLTGGQLTINHDVNINGPAANSLIVNGNNASRVFTVNSGKVASISSLTISGGREAVDDGGAIRNNGTLTLKGVTLSGNVAINGGGIRSDGSLVLSNTTISGNLAKGEGGGLYNAIGQATLTNVTVAYNTSDSDNSGSEAGGGIFRVSGNVLLHNTIVADNFKRTSGAVTDDIGGSVDSLSSYNVVGTGSGGLINGSGHNQVGVASALLGALMNNGGPTFTHGLLYNSPALDAGDNAVTLSPLFLNVDQRGVTRPQPTGGTIDIGAYERLATETRNAPDGQPAKVDINDVRLTFPCVPSGGCGTFRAKGDTLQPNIQNNSVDLSVTAVPGDAPSGSGPAFDVTPSSNFYDSPVTVCFYLPSITNPTTFANLKVLHRQTDPSCPTAQPCLVDNGSTPDFPSKTVCTMVTSFSQFVIKQAAVPTATNGNVSGQIVDSVGNPVEGAAVRMSGTQNRLTVTAANGRYNFDEVETNGFYTVIPSRPNFVFSPSQRSFSALGQHTEATFNASASGSGLNPLDATAYFVRQQYLDFLGREPDEAGFNFWVNNIESCGADQNCRAIKYIDTSAAFFLSIEFQQTGYLVYRTYQAAYGDMPGAPVPIKLGEFKPDTTEIGNGVVVNKTGWEAALETNKRAFVTEFVQRSRFAGAYPTTMTPADFVDKLFVNAGVTPTTDDRTAAISEFGSSPDSSDVSARGRALRRVAENSALAHQEFNQAFVLMQYFGYLRRDANTRPDTDFGGFTFWLNKLNGFNGNFGDAEMVKAFLLSGEYRGRFPR